MVSGHYSLLRRVGFSLRRLLLWSTGPRALGLQQLWLPGARHWHNSCGSRAQWLCGTWDLPESGWNPRLLRWQADSLPLSHEGGTSHLISSQYLREGYCYDLNSVPFLCPTPPIHRLKSKFPVAQSMNDPVRKQGNCRCN